LPNPTKRASDKVVVAYATTGTHDHRFTASLLDLWRFDAIGGRVDGKRVGGHHRILRGGGRFERVGSSISRNRNQLASLFLEEHDAPWLFTVDDDMDFEPDIVEQLLAAADPVERPVMGGLCFQYRFDDPVRKLWPTLFAHIPGTTKLARLQQYPADSVIQVAATGAACMLVHRSVLEAMAAKFPKPRPWYDRTPFYDHDADGKAIPETGDEYSEDITFCLRAQACGFPIHVHTGAKTGHVKSFVADEELFINESAQLAVSTHSPATQAPTYVVVASKSRRGMLTRLLEQLKPQVAGCFVYDNGYTPPLRDSIEAHGWPLHRMWNDGLAQAEKAAGGKPHNVLIINDDVEVEGHCAALLDGALRASDDHWVAYPNWHGADIPLGAAVETSNPEMAGQTMSGWCFMLRGETGLRFDEQFEWWYGDSDLQRKVEQGGGKVVCVGGCHAIHHDPLRSTVDDPDRLAQARADEARFAAKWGIDPETLWLAQNLVSA